MYRTTRVNFVLPLALLCSAFVSSSAVDYVCNEYQRYYSQNISFSNVFIKDSTSYGFKCHNNGYPLTITFQNSTLEDVPKKLFDTFRALYNVTLSNCSIMHINRYSLEHASQLQILDLSWNALQEVRSFAFTGASALVMLNLAFNNISTIDGTAFHALPLLRVLYLQGNKLRTLDSVLFSELTALRHLFLHHNELELLEGGLFAKNQQLVSVMLENNKLSVVDEDTFTTDESTTFTLVSLKNNKLTKLNMGKMRVKKILLANNALEEVYISPWVRAMYAENNRITRILADSPEEMLIETLSLENNAITKLDPINRLRSLKTLDLANNTLGALGIDSFAKLTNLEELRLERTGVTNLQHGTFAQQESLTWLDLSYNNLDRIDLDILTSSTRLLTLYLDGNRLQSIDYAHLRQMFPALAELGLVDNRWNCTFLSSVVRYCNEHTIKLIKGASSDDMQNRTNVKGIYCYDEKNPIRHWNETVQHVLAANTSETGALQAVLQNVLDDVQRFGDGHTEAAARTAQLEGTVSDLTKRQLALDNALLDLRKSLLDMRLTLLANRTNDSTVGGDELRRMIDSVNSLTLDKQKLSEEKLDLKINKQSYQVDQALETAKANSDKLTVLGKRVEQWISNMAASGGVGFFGAAHQQQQQPRQDTVGGDSQGLLVAVLVMVCLMTGVLVFALWRSSRRTYGVDRRRYTHRDSSLTTIVDNDI